MNCTYTYTYSITDLSVPSVPEVIVLTSNYLHFCFLYIYFTTWYYDIRIVIAHGSSFLVFNIALQRIRFFNIEKLQYK